VLVPFGRCTQLPRETDREHKAQRRDLGPPRGTHADPEVDLREYEQAQSGHNAQRALNDLGRVRDGMPTVSRCARGVGWDERPLSGIGAK
jgi:hypothetical protein